MAQEKSRLDVAFPFDDDARVQEGLRGLTRVLEARLQNVEASRADYEEAINLLTGVAITRIDDVLRPALEVVQTAIEIGFPSDRLTDSGSVGRAVLQAATHAALVTALQVTIDDLVGLPALGKQVAKASTHVDLANALALVVSDVNGAAPLASPVFTGAPKVPTATQTVNDTTAASTAYVRAALAALIASSPATLDTLNELAAALGNDPAFATTITNSIGLRLLKASPAFTGIMTGPDITLTNSITSPNFVIDTQAFFRKAGSRIQIAADETDYIEFDRTTGVFRHITGNTVRMTVGPAGVGIPDLAATSTLRERGYQVFAAFPFAAGSWGAEIGTGETILTDVTITARGYTCFAIGSCRIHNSGAIVDLCYYMRVYNRSTGDSVVFALERIVTAEAWRSGTAVISFPVAFWTTPETSYLIRFSARKISENGSAVWAPNDCRIDGISC